MKIIAAKIENGVAAKFSIVWDVATCCDDACLKTTNPKKIAGVGGGNNQNAETLKKCNPIE